MHPTSTVDTYRDFDSAVEAFRRAQELFVTGDPRAVSALYSRRDDVTLANPLGPPCRGPAAVDEAAALAAAQLSDGTVSSIEEVSRFSTADLGYVVAIERTQARVAGDAAQSAISLRSTVIFRREGEAWKVVHRHADPITTPRSITTAVEACGPPERSC